MKYMQAYAEVDLDAIRHNISEMRRQIGKDAKLLAVIKADAYGHGAVPVAEALEDLSDCYAVAHLSEAAELRRSGIKKDILILNVMIRKNIRHSWNRISSSISPMRRMRELHFSFCVQNGLQARTHVR